MRTRILRRKVIIREDDYNKVYSQALETSLYDRGHFIPLNEDNLEKLKLIDLLKGKSTPITELVYDLSMPAVLLYHLKDNLYDQRYYDWNASVDEEGIVCVQARKNTPKSRIGWAVFEKDLVCRI